MLNDFVGGWGALGDNPPGALGDKPPGADGNDIPSRIGDTGALNLLILTCNFDDESLLATWSSSHSQNRKLNSTPQIHLKFLN